jgi:hypothetical protein
MTAIVGQPRTQGHVSGRAYRAAQIAQAAHRQARGDVGAFRLRERGKHEPAGELRARVDHFVQGDPVVRYIGRRFRIDDAIEEHGDAEAAVAGAAHELGTDDGRGDERRTLGRERFHAQRLRRFERPLAVEVLVDRQMIGVARVEDDSRRSARLESERAQHRMRHRAATLRQRH